MPPSARSAPCPASPSIAGGGVRDLAAVERLARLGVRRIAIGTALVRDPAFAAEAARQFGDLVVADVAARGERCA